jgi:hypothetical protein
VRGLLLARGGGDIYIYIYRKRERERAGAASGIERKRGDI